MRIALLLCIFLLVACEHVDDEEMDYIGRWTWHAVVDEFSEYGYVELRSDRTYSFHHVMKNPTETLTMSYPYEYHSPWYLVDGEICFRRSAEGESPIEEDCIFVAKKDSEGNPVVSIYGGMTGVEMPATREAQ